jgi:hypothetical protein
MTFTPVTGTDYNVGFAAGWGKSGIIWDDSVSRLCWYYQVSWRDRTKKPEKGDRPTVLKWYRGKKTAFFVSGNAAVPDK